MFAKKVFFLLVLVLYLFGSVSVAAAANKSKKQKLDKMILRIDQKFAEFGEKIENKINKETPDNVREQLLIPFIVMKINQDNTMRNMVRIREDGQKNKNERYALDNVNYFFFDFEEDSQGQTKFTAYFSPIERTVYIGENFNPDCAFDLITLYREIFHATQDANDRVLMNSESDFIDYLNFYSIGESEKPRLLINYQVTAYTCELELMNIYLDDYFEKVSKSQSGSSPPYVMKCLQSDLSRGDLIIKLCETADIYFKNRLPHLDNSVVFVRHIAKSYFDAGFDLFFSSAGVKEAIGITMEELDRIEN